MYALRDKTRLVVKLAKLNLSLNMKKCRALVDRCTPEEVALLLDAGFQLDYGCTRSLGSPIGAVEACKAFILRKVAAWEKLQHEDLHPSKALKVCGNVKFEHLARTPMCVKRQPTSLTRSCSRRPLGFLE